MRTASGKTIYDDDAPIFYSEAQADYYRDEVTVEAARAKVQWITRFVPSGGRLLDVGANFGHFVQQASGRYEAVGLEPSPTVVAWAREHLGARLEVGSVEQDIADFHGRFDAITMFDVIEHLRDPFRALDRLHHALVPGGLLVLSTVDAESWSSRMIGKRLEDFRRTREHLFFFGRETMRRILEQHGYEVLSVRSIGHTFELGFLLDRMSLYNRPLFRSLHRAVEAVGLGKMQIYLNPFTKMIVYARRR